MFWLYVSIIIEYLVNLVFKYLFFLNFSLGWYLGNISFLKVFERFYIVVVRVEKSWVEEVFN